MARPREFNPETAISGAMSIFWRLGFKGTNLPDLLDAMGITRGSFYKAFGDKEAVYLEALDLYDRTEIETAVTLLGSHQEAADADCIARLFAPREDDSIGCFGCNAMVEMAPVNKKVAEKTSVIATRFRDAVKDRLIRSGASHDIAQDRADMILTLYFGSKTLAKTGVRSGNWPARISQILTK